MSLLSPRLRMKRGGGCDAGGVRPVGAGVNRVVTIGGSLSGARESSAATWSQRRRYPWPACETSTVSRVIEGAPEWADFRPLFGYSARIGLKNWVRPV